DQGGETSCEEVSRKQCIVHSLSSIRKFFAGSGMRNFERNRAMSPDLPNHPADSFLHADVGRVIVAAMDDRNSRLAIHKPIKDLFTDGRHTGSAQSFVNDRSNDRHRLSTADQRITKLIGMHSHK